MNATGMRCPGGFLAPAGPDDGPPLVQSAPRRPLLAGAVSEPALAALLPRAPRPSRLALAAGLGQVLDFWEASHHAAQEADDLGEREFSAYWHGIAHRREPDPGNAAYWFRKAGHHPTFTDLSHAAIRILERIPDAEFRTGKWDPFAFIAFCDRARTQPGSAQGNSDSK